MNSREKGARTMRKAAAYASATWPGCAWFPFRQLSYYAQPQPFDALLLIPQELGKLVECRSNQWGVSKSQTRRLASLPTWMVEKEIWRFRDGQRTPDRRRWNGRVWVMVTEQNP